MLVNKVLALVWKRSHECFGKVRVILGHETINTKHGILSLPMNNEEQLMF
jgi:hypothetical protein